MKLKITIEGAVYEVDVDVSEPEPEGPTYHPPLHTRVSAAPSAGGGGGGAAPAGEPSGDGKVCRSPLAGSISRIDVEVGQEIAVDDVLLVLEAMKMETVVTAPTEGTVKAINARVGDSVTQGQVLVEIE